MGVYVFVLHLCKLSYAEVLVKIFEATSVLEFREKYVVCLTVRNQN
jgi:hypothetical protein